MPTTIQTRLSLSITGQTTSYEIATGTPAYQSPVSGSTLTPVSQGITGLTENTLYHYRVNAGTSHGNDITFTTVGACATLADGSFEGGTPNASWTETSINFGTPLCTVEVCDGAGPRTGAWWAWFGGISRNDRDRIADAGGCNPLGIFSPAGILSLEQYFERQRK